MVYTTGFNNFTCPRSATSNILETALTLYHLVLSLLAGLDPLQFQLLDLNAHLSEMLFKVVYLVEHILAIFGLKLLPVVAW